MRSLPTQPDQSKLSVVNLSTDIFLTCDMFKYFSHPNAALISTSSLLTTETKLSVGTISKALCGLVLKVFHVMCFWPGCWTAFSWYWLGQEEASKGDFLFCTVLGELFKVNC